MGQRAIEGTIPELIEIVATGALDPRLPTSTGAHDAGLRSAAVGEKVALLVPRQALRESRTQQV